ncbi:MAG: hypothetical protein ACOCP4_00860 [Candidatus Woesearchaeota archaeon]
MSGKPKCKLIGEDGNIFSLVGKASKILVQNGMNQSAREMENRVFESNSYEEAIYIIGEYVEIE